MNEEKIKKHRHLSAHLYTVAKIIENVADWGMREQDKTNQQLILKILDDLNGVAARIEERFNEIENELEELLDERDQLILNKNNFNNEDVN